MSLRGTRATREFTDLCAAQLRPGGGARNFRLLGPGESTALVSAVRDLYGVGLPAPPDCFLTAPGWTAFVLTAPGLAANHSLQGAIQSIILVAAPVSAGQLADNSDLLDGLLLRIRATAVSASRHESMVMAMVTDKLHSALVQTPGSLKAALDLAVSVTGSDGGAVYLMQSSREVVYRAVAHQGLSSVSLAPEIRRNSDSAVSWSVEQHRPYQMSPQLGAAARPGVTAPPTGVELITPIPGPLASPATPAVGALALYRAGRSRGFTAYDQALARNVALRIALLHATNLSGSLAAAISGLNARTPLDRARESSRSPRRTAAWLLPADYQEVLDRIHGPLKQLCDATYSQSVTMRLALPDARSAAPHGLTLVRCAAHPRIRIRDKHRALREADGGLSWTVMQTGTHEDVRDVVADGRYLEVRPGVASEVCAPIKAHGATIGTLNLESPIRDNYAASLPSVLAFAGAVGRAFEEAASARAKQVIDQAALSIAKRHAIDNYVTDLQRSLRKEVLSGSGQQALDTFAKRARQTLAEMRGKAVIDAVGSATLKEVIESSLQRLDTTMAAPAVPAACPFDAELDPARATATALALTNLFQNAISHVDPTPRGTSGTPQRRMGFARTRLDGRICAVIAIENQIRLPLPAGRLAGLYHYPLTGKNDELRLGAFLAGLAAQRAGGRLHAFQSADAQTLTSILVIPAEVPEAAL